MLLEIANSTDIKTYMGSGELKVRYAASDSHG